MKIGIISDIHGNIDALKSVLDDIRKEACEKIFCLGDLAMAGPEPDNTINFVRELMKSTDFTLIQGNTDLMLSKYSEEVHNKLIALNTVMANAYEADIKEISEDNKKFLASLDKQKEIELFGVKILLVHGSPRKQDENIFPDMPLSEVEGMLTSTDAELIFCGHTHLPCGYQTTTKKTVVNVGSVGRPFSQYPESCYVVLDIKSDSSYEIRHKLISYDFMKASEKIKNRNFVGAEKLAQMLIKATSRYPE